MQIYWIWYALLGGLNDGHKMALLDRFSDPEEIYHASYEDILHVLEDPKKAEEVLSARDLQPAQNILEICGRKQIGIVTFADPAYPERLRNIVHPPLVLYYKGQLPDFSGQPQIAVVGTRRATAYGLSVARRLSRQIAACGGLVVSGAAAGIDASAMTGAMEADGTVVGVLGCGVDVVYPRTNKQLFEQICKFGCLISEYPPGTKPYKWNFPRRNRIVSGLSHGVLVVEAPEGSGALITAELAMEQGRDVFVVPGNIDIAACAGSNALLKDYAAAVCCGWDVMRDYESLFPGVVAQREAPCVQEQTVRQTNATFGDSCVSPDKKFVDIPAATPYSKASDLKLTEEEKAVVSCIGESPVLIDDVIAQVRLPAGNVLAMLTMLALRGVIQNHPGRRVSLKRN